MITKDQLTAKTRSTSGTIVRYDGPVADPRIKRDTYIVKDLYTAKVRNDPSRVAIGPADLGVAFTVALSDLTID
jgi:hypothetical protein